MIPCRLIIIKLWIVSCIFLFFPELYAQQSWNWLNPKPQGNTLKDIIIFDETTMLAVGENSTIIKTTDGGNTWDVQIKCCNKTACLNSVYFINENTGWTVGNYGVILKTIDGGAHWVALESGTVSNIQSVFFKSESLGWLSIQLTPYTDQVLYTTDGGNNWQPLFSYSECFYSMFFTDKNNGWLVGNKIYKTENGGETWQYLYANAIGRAPCFISEKLGWGIGTTSIGNDPNYWIFVDEVIKTTDGGETGNHLASPGSTARSDPLDKVLTSICFVDSLTGWLVSKAGDLFKSGDGGSTWEIKELKIKAGFNVIKFFNTEIGWIAGNNGILYKTTDGGDNWHPFTISHENFNSVYFQNENTGWMVGEEGSILKTTDGGNTWTTRESGTPYFLKSICFVTPTTGWIVGSAILKTTDGGETWINKAPNKTDCYCNDGFFISPNTGWVIEGNGKIIKTSDGGDTWIKQSAESSSLLSVYFLNKNTGWVAGYGGHILTTTDGGSSWHFLSNVPSEMLNDLFFIDIKTGWAVDNNGSIFKTTDGGLNWSKQSFSYPWLTSVFFINENNGWVVGSEGTIYSTSDGGINWIDNSNDASTFFKSVFFINEKTGWIVGDKGAILKTTNGGKTFVEEQGTQIQNADDLLLIQNYPNPFNPATSISYSLPQAGHVTLAVYDVLGRQVQVLVNGQQTAGKYTAEWHAGNSPSGVYFYRLQTGAVDLIRKMMLIR